MKAITPVISLIMLMLITVGIVGVSYAWFSGLTTSSIQKAIAIPPGGAYCSNGEIKAYVLNNGDTTLTTQDILVAQVDGADVKGTPFFGDLSSGLVGWWKFDEMSGSTFYDSSENNNNGNLGPSCPDCPEWKSGKVGNALQFDGVNDFASASGTSLNINNGITVSAWFFPKTVPQDSSVRGIVMNGWAWSFYLQNKILSGFFNDESVPINYIGAGAVSANQWHNLAAAYDSNTNIMVLYLDGIGYADTPNGLLQVGGSTVKIGDTPWGNQILDGLIDEVKIYNKVTGDVNIQPGAAGLILNSPGTEGKHTIRIGTSSNTVENIVTCA